MQMAEGDACPHCGKHTNYEGNPMHLPAGCVVHGAHPYVIGAALGQGGFGITYIALDMVTGVRVAIKEFFPTFCSGRTGGSSVTPYQSQEETFSKGKARFLEEAQVLKSLSDLKGIVNVLDLFQSNNSAYLVMEYLEGCSLKEHVSKNGKVPAQEFLRQIRPLMEDIHRMHQRGVVHRDIAPDNIILLPDGQMKLIDFGAARSFFGDRSMTVVVKKGFAPVEQYMTKGTTAATDVYALAATIYYCITGTVPLDSAERQYDGTSLQSPVALGAKLTPAQEKALGRALEILQKNRTQTVQQFLDDLRVSDVVPPKASVPKKDADPVPEKNAPKPAPRRKPSVLVTALIIPLFLLAGAFLFLVVRCDHFWLEATCTKPQTCVYCGKTRGSTLDHVWTNPTCISPSTCYGCMGTKGEPLGHTWAEATYAAPKTCTTCKITKGPRLKATPIYLNDLGALPGHVGKLWLRSSEAPSGTYHTKKDANPENWDVWSIPGYTGGKVLDSAGNEHNCGIYIDGKDSQEYYMEFRLDGKYTKFSGMCASPDRQSAVSSHVHNSGIPYEKYFVVYCDGVYEGCSPVMRSTQDPQYFEFDVTGVQVLKILYPETAGPNEIATIYDGLLS